MSASRTQDKQKQRDMAAKTMHDLQEGKLPQNDDIVRGIETLQKNIDKTKPNLSQTGQKASEHVANILDTAKDMVESKNRDEHLQKSVYHMYQAGKDEPIAARISKLKEILLPGEDVDIKGVQTQARQHVDNLLTIVKLCIMSPEFRETLNEFFSFFSSVLHKSSKQLESKFQQSHGYQPQSSPGAGEHQAQQRHLAQGSGGQAVDKSSIIANEEAIKSSLAQHFGERAQHVEGQHLPGSQHFYEPEQHYQWVEKDGKYSLQRTQMDSNEWKLSREQEDKLLDHLVNLLQSVHKYAEFSNSVEFLSDSLHELQANWRENLQKINEQVIQGQEGSSSKMHRQASKRELIEFIENWIGEDYSLDPLIDAVLQVRDIVQHDPELKQLFHDLRMFFTKSAKDANYVNDKERVRYDARDLIDRTRNLLLNKHRGEFQRLRRELSFMNDAIQRDDSLFKLRDDVKELVRTLTTDQNGSPTLKPELLSDAQFLVQALFDTIKYLPLPPIEREDDDGTLRLENVVVNCTDILPSQIKISTTLDATGKNNNSLELRMSHIRAHVRNAKFFIDKRSGFPHIKESGFVDIDLAGKNGLDLFISVRPELPVPNREGNISKLFTVTECSCNISKLRLRLRDTKHDALYKFLSPVINSIARKRIETLVQDQIEKAINAFNSKSVSVVNKAREQGAEVVSKAKETAKKAKGKHEEKSDRMQISPEPAHHKTAFQQSTH